MRWKKDGRGTGKCHTVEHRSGCRRKRDARAKARRKGERERAKTRGRSRGMEEIHRQQLSP